MKLIAPAQVTKVNELLDLLTDPARFAQYLLTLKQLQDSINDKVGLIESAEELDRLKIAAAKDLEEAKRRLVAVESREAELSNLELVTEAELAEAREELSQERAVVSADLDQRRQAAVDAEAKLAETRRELDQTAAELAALEQKLDNRERDLDDRKKRLAEKIKLFQTPI